MSTRSQIAFYADKSDKLKKPFTIIYRHHDGMPDRVLPSIMPILKKFHKGRGMDDITYASGYLFYKLADKTTKQHEKWKRKAKKEKESTSYYDQYMLLPLGLSDDFHCDIEYLYAIYPDGDIRYYSVNNWDDELKTTLLATVSVNDKVPTFCGECEKPIKDGERTIDGQWDSKLHIDCEQKRLDEETEWEKEKIKKKAADKAEATTKMQDAEKSEKKILKRIDKLVMKQARARAFEDLASVYIDHCRALFDYHCAEAGHCGPFIIEKIRPLQKKPPKNIEVEFMLYSSEYDRYFN